VTGFRHSKSKKLSKKLDEDEDERLPQDNGALEIGENCWL
jgi:hypothetical protein